MALNFQNITGFSVETLDAWQLRMTKPRVIQLLYLGEVPS